MSVLRKIARNNLERQTGFRNPKDLISVKQNQINKWKEREEFQALSKDEQKKEIRRIFFPEQTNHETL